MNEDINLAKSSISQFMEEFGSADDPYTNLFLEVLFEELFNGNALPLSYRKKQEGDEVSDDPLWTNIESESGNGQ